jgi:hypothetical protein
MQPNMPPQPEVSAIAVSAHEGSLRRPMHRRWQVVMSLLAACVLIAVASIAHNHNGLLIRQEQESPFDFVQTTVLSPIYSAVCPQSQRQCTVNFTLYVLNARPLENTTFSDWNNSLLSSGSHRLEILNTTGMSRAYKNTRCAKLQWHHRLNFVYQSVFRQVMQDNPENEGFFFTEDDAVLENWAGYHEEACIAQSFEFYSFFKTSGTTCIYRHGTVAFYIKKSLMMRFINVDSSTFCRLPIDMFFASLGPWYTSINSTVTHRNKRYIPS